MLVKEKSTDEYISVNLIENYHPTTPFPEKSVLPKITFERQKYLFDKIRQYCAFESQNQFVQIQREVFSWRHL